MSKTINLEGIPPSIWETIQYVNIDVALKSFPVIHNACLDYIKGMQLPRIPGEIGTCVYYTDWNGFVKKYMWETMNTPPTLLHDKPTIGLDQ